MTGRASLSIICSNNCHILFSFVPRCVYRKSRPTISTVLSHFSHKISHTSYSVNSWNKFSCWAMVGADTKCPSTNISHISKFLYVYGDIMLNNRAMFPTQKFDSISLSHTYKVWIYITLWKWLKFLSDSQCE